MNRRPSSGLLGLRWRRVILDEAHSIRNTVTDQVCMHFRKYSLTDIDARARVLCDIYKLPSFRR